MDFSYPETHIEIKNLSNQILTDLGDPERLKKLESTSGKAAPYFDRDLWQQLVESGLHSASLPESVGGMGLDSMASDLIAEEIGRSVVSVPFIPCIISAALPLADSGSNAAIAELLVKVVRGNAIITTAFIEPGNEDSFKPQTSAELNGDSVIINGTKHCVPYAQHAESILIFAKSSEGLVASLVNTQASGVTVTEQLATSNEPQAQVELTNAEATLVAKSSDAEALLQKAIALTTTAYVNMAVGIADKMMRIAGEYTSQREQFGVPIATFQAVAHRLADCYIDVETQKIIALKASNDCAQGDYQNNSVNIAKLTAGDVLHRVSQASQHVHGGAGIDRDYHLWRYCLWAKQIELTLGSSRVHLEILADRLEKEYLSKAG